MCLIFLTQFRKLVLRDSFGGTSSGEACEYIPPPRRLVSVSMDMYLHREGQRTREAHASTRYRAMCHRVLVEGGEGAAGVGVAQRRARERERIAQAPSIFRNTAEVAAGGIRRSRSSNRAGLFGNAGLHID